MGPEASPISQKVNASFAMFPSSLGLGIERRFQAFRELTRRANAPIVQEDRARGFLDHVVMQCHNLDAGSA
jgi:hypothetical protein